MQVFAAVGGDQTALSKMQSLMDQLKKNQARRLQEKSLKWGFDFAAA